ncbi:MAG: mechanosensitive ion channel family protein [Blautia sp.]
MNWLTGAVIMGLRVWVPTEKYWNIKWRLNEKIKEAFDENHIAIPYPQMDAHVVAPSGEGKR